MLTEWDTFTSGTYPIKPCLPAVGGNEGVGEVLAIGSGVKDINVGDWALMASSGQGKVHGNITQCCQWAVWMHISD